MLFIIAHQRLLFIHCVGSGSLFSAETPQHALAPSLLELGAASRQLMPPLMLVANSADLPLLLGANSADLQRLLVASSADLRCLVARLQAAWRFVI